MARTRRRGERVGRGVGRGVAQRHKKGSASPRIAARPARVSSRSTPSGAEHLKARLGVEGAVLHGRELLPQGPQPPLVAGRRGRRRGGLSAGPLGHCLGHCLGWELGHEQVRVGDPALAWRRPGHPVAGLVGLGAAEKEAAPVALGSDPTEKRAGEKQGSGELEHVPFAESHVSATGVSLSALSLMRTPLRMVKI